MSAAIINQAPAWGAWANAGELTQKIQLHCLERRRGEHNSAVRRQIQKRSAPDLPTVSQNRATSGVEQINLERGGDVQELQAVLESKSTALG
jgi:hypothetical protein